VRDACRHPTRQPTKVMPSKLTREDAAHGDDAAKRQEEGACGKNRAAAFRRRASLAKSALIAFSERVELVA
jgi:hypothetical protein